MLGKLCRSNNSRPLGFPNEEISLLPLFLPYCNLKKEQEKEKTQEQKSYPNPPSFPHYVIDADLSLFPRDSPENMWIFGRVSYKYAENLRAVLKKLVPDWLENTYYFPVGFSLFDELGHKHSRFRQFLPKGVGILQGKDIQLRLRLERQIVISIANSPSDIGLTDRQCFSEIHERLVAGNGNSCTTLGLTAGKVVFILRCLLCYAAALPDKTA
ncbi:hypothetical protein DAPPUDRAFT_112976 [Daphnia pulex]|uniref:Uncharacterized protein n=1 Tax=Daphnia pulex TaxID=6669 RepID=E9HDM9_DAPPU|nr:hypothetical protein DAPPUDRAFT_112976 [Daphnia pulex]|eukprot:EFX70175.1 hypothetical protein DAPPUDRAFT_112976 [Daphnia pulex]